MVMDALGREVRAPRAPRRVVSLVPSETESVCALAGLERLVGRTDFCEEPAGTIERVPSVGGTKKCDVGRVLALAPDLVLANKEENGRADVEALIAAGLTVHVSFPCTVRESVEYLESLAELLHVERSHDAIREAREALERAEARALPSVRACVPIWREPWMSFDGRTFASDVLRLAGAENVFADRPRRFPLAAELDPSREALPAERTAERDTRYPRFGLDELRARDPEIVLLPDEPYAFGEADVAALLDAGFARERIALVSGKDLFWYGVRPTGALARVAARIDALRS